MEYGSVIKTAWSMTWRHRFLWVLGLFAASTTGTFFGFGRPGAPPAGPPPALGPAGAFAQPEALGLGMGLWLQSHPGVVASIVGAGLLVGLALLVVSIISQGGMAVSTVRLARGEPATLGSAWRDGTHIFWRYVLLFLACIAVAIVGTLVAAFAVSILVALASVGTAGAFIGLRIAAVLVPVLLLLSIPFTIVMAFAQRLVAVEHTPIWASLGEGWRLLRTHWLEAGVAWLISVGLAIGLAIALALAAGIVLAILGAIGFGIWSAAGIAAVIAYGSVGLLALFAGVWLTSAIYNTFFWSYWSLVYLDFHGGEHEPALGELPRAA